MLKKIIIVCFIIFTFLLVYKLVFIGPESIKNLLKRKHYSDSLNYKLVKYELKRTLLSYKKYKLSNDSNYWQRFFRLAGFQRKNETFFLIREDTLILIYDNLDIE